MEYTNGDVYNGQWDEGDIHGQVMLKQQLNLSTTGHCREVAVVGTFQ